LIRAGPLSDDKVIDLLNHYFVPIVTSNDDYNETGAAPPEEKAERLRIAIDSKRVEKNNPIVVTPKSGSADIVAYIIGADGRVDSTMRLMDLADPEKVAAFLETAVTKLKVPRGKTPWSNPGIS
jgi:hypothetical protein